MNFSTEDMALACSGRIVGSPTAVNGMEYDSRAEVQDRLFVAASNSGFEFVGDAFRKGAVAYMAEKEAPVIGSGIVVDDVSIALRSIASVARSRMSPNVIGVTGSVGKTTVKDLIVTIATRRGVVSSSRGNFNNDFGVAHTLINANEKCDTLIVEMGMRATGEIRRLAELAQPNVGVITRIGESHLGELGDQQAIAGAKSELVAALPVTGTAVLNAEQEWVDMLRSRTAANVVTFGTDSGDVRASKIVLDETGRASFVLHTPGEQAQVRLMLHGTHNAVNAAAAAAACLVIGIPLEAVVVGLESATGPRSRMTFERSISGATVIDDAYNASPTSTKAALATLASMNARGRRVAMLGEMAELGERAAGFHDDVAEYARTLDIELIPISTDLYGGPPISFEAAIDCIQQMSPGDAVLIKASRAVGLDRIVKAVTIPAKKA